MNCGPLNHGLRWAGFFFIGLANFLVESQLELEGRESQLELEGRGLGVEDLMINEKVAKGLWYDIPLSSQTMEGVLALGHSRDMCKDLNSCQINTWIITLDMEHLLTAVKVTSMNGVSTEIEDLMVYIAKGEEEPEMCGTFNGKGITTGIYFVFCQSPILGRIVTVKTRMKLVNEQVFQVQTGIKIYAVRKTTFEDQEIYVYNKLVTQIGVFQYFMAEFATDGNFFTEAVACYPCDGKTDYGYGWWQIDLGSDRIITRLEVYTSSNQFYANTLQQITVGVSLRNITNQDQFTKCGDFKEAYQMPLNSKIDVYCREPVNGRYVTITRQRIAKFRPDMIVLAEIKIFEKKNSHPEAIPSMPRPAWEILREKLIIGEWVAVFLYGAKATQAGFLVGFGPELALDGDPNTCSLACGNCNGGTDLLGWWKVSFTMTHEIVAIELLSSRNTMEESNYLQEFEVVVFNNGNPARCSEYRNRTIIPQGTQIFLVCSQILQGNVIMIRRLSDSKFAREKLAIADIKIYSKKRYEPPPPPTPRVPPGRPARLLYLYTEQGGTFSFYLSDFAIDGVLDTFSISCLACDGGSAVGLGWWKIDLEKSRLISGVQLFPSFDEENGRSLLGVEIGISTHQISVSDSFAICGEVFENVQISHGSWISVICTPSQLSGRYLIVRKKEGARYKPDSVSIAEIRIYVTDGSHDYVGGRPPTEVVDIWVIHRYVTQEKWIRINLIDLEATQSDTQSNFGPQLAIDGNIYTFSVACNPCSIGRFIGVAWWAVEFEAEFEVTAVEIISSPTEFESNYLQEFLVRVGSGESGGQSSICAEYVNRTRISISSVIVLQCRIAIRGMRLVVERLPNSKFKKEAIAIAEIKVYAVKVIPVNPQVIIEERIGTKQWTLVPLSPGSFKDVTKINYKEILFTCGYCGMYVISYSVHIVVVFSVEVSVVGVQITFNENFNPSNLPNFQVFVENTDGESDLCAEFKRGRNVISDRKLSLTCSQPEKGKVVLTKGTWTQRTQIVSSLYVYTLASDSKVFVTDEVIDMTRLVAEQSSTPDAHGKASNAIDGDVLTLSKAYGTKVEAVAWWKVDMRLNYFVKGVFITSAMNQYESYHLQQFEILVITITQQERICVTYMGSPFGPGDRKPLYCGVVMNGRYVMIRKRRDSYNKDVLTMAEVEIVVNRQASQNYPPAGPPQPPVFPPLPAPGFPPRPIPGGPSGGIPWLQPLPPPGPIPGGWPGPIPGPGSIPGGQPGGWPGPIPGGRPEPIPGGRPGPIPGGRPGPIPIPGGQPGGWPRPIPGGRPGPIPIPGGQSGGQPGGQPGGWPGGWHGPGSGSIPGSKPGPIPIPGGQPGGQPGGWHGPGSGSIPGGKPGPIPIPGGQPGGWHGPIPGSIPGGKPGPIPIPGGQPGGWPGPIPGPGSRPGPSPGWIPGSVPGPSSGWIPGSVPGPSSGWIPGSVPGPSPGWIPGSVPGPSSGWIPGSVPGPSPGGIPGLMPGPSPGGIPGFMPGWTFGQYEFEFDPFDPSLPESQRPKQPWRFDIQKHQWYIIYLNIKYYVKFTTSKTHYYHIPIPSVALDGYVKTCSRTCFGCNNNVGSGIGWWHYEFPSSSTITAVELLACHDGIECLRDVVVGVSDWNTTKVEDLNICAETSQCETGSAPKWMKLHCHSPVTGNYLIIIRKRTPTNGINALSLAEIRVKDEYGSYIVMIKADYSGRETTVEIQGQSWENDPFVLNSPGYKNEVWNYDFATGRWFLVTSTKRYYVTISSMNANTRYYHIPIAEAALDGYMKTCSKTCFCNNQDNKGQGWWHFQFPTVTTISEVQLISCYDGVECLQDIVVGVSNKNTTNERDLQICAENVACSGGHAEPQWLRLRCRSPVTGSYLIIMRRRTPPNGINTISIAEIKVKDQFDRYIDMIHAETFPLPDEGWSATGNVSFGATYDTPSVTGYQTSWTFNKVPVVTGERSVRYRTHTQTRVRTIGHTSGSQQFYKGHSSPTVSFGNFHPRPGRR